MNYIYLIIFEAIAFVLLLIRYKNNLLHPSLVLISAYLVCTLFGLFKWDLWDLSSYSIKTTIILSCTIFVFVLFGLVSDLIRSRNSNIQIKQTSNTISLPLYFLVFVFFFCLFAVAIYALYFRANYGSFFIGTSKNTVSVSIPFYIDMIGRITRLLSFFCAFVFANRLSLKKVGKKYLLLIPCSISYSVICLFLNSRIELLKVASCFFAAYYLFSSFSNNKKKTNGFRFVAIFGVALASLIGIFYFLRLFKAGDSNNYDFLDYISMYISAPLKLFDMFIKDPQPTIGWGDESFNNLTANLQSLGFINWHSTRHLEFRGMYGYISLGNVYGAPRRFYHDFGMFGTLLLTALESTILCSIYWKVKESKKKSFLMLFFCFVFCVIPMFPIDDIFYSDLSVGYVLNIILFYLLYSAFIKKRNPLIVRSFSCRTSGVM